MKFPKFKIIVILLLFISYYSSPMLAIAQSEEDPLSAVVTGDADLEVELNNDINQNNTETANVEEDAGVEFENDNVSELANNLEGGGNTGDNTVDGGEGDALIISGDVGMETFLENDINAK